MSNLQTLDPLPEAEDYLQLVKSFAQAVWETDPTGMYMADSPSWRSYTGQTFKQWEREGWAGAVHPQDRSQALKRWQHAVQTKTHLDAEYRLQRPGDNWQWTNVRAAAIFNADGSIKKWVGFNIDISQKKQAQEALSESEQRYRILFESIDEGFCTIQVLFDDQEKPVDYRFLQVNPAFLRHTGLLNAVGKTIRELAPTHEEFWFETYGRIAMTGQPARFEHQAAALGRFYDGYAFRIGPADQNQVAILFNDILGRKKTEQALQDSEARLVAIFDSLPVGVAQIDLQGRVLVANKAMERFMPTGLLPSKDDARHDRWLAYHADGRRLQRSDYPGARALQGEHVLPPIEMRYTQDDGSIIWTHVAAVPIRNDQGSITGQVTIVTDINELKLAEKALKEADQRKDEFLAMLAHELRNPMASVRNGLSVLAQTNPKEDSITQQTVAIMDRQVDHLVRLIDDLLEVSRITQNKIELRCQQTDLAAIVLDAVRNISDDYAAAGKQLSLSALLSPIIVLGDATRLSQVVTNLLTNGLRYSGAHGQVSVSLTQQDGNALIKVADNGIGLTPDQLNSIFELFVQADNSVARAQGGLGIGLTLVQRLVKMHGGHVEARSPGLGQGSEFVVSLPIVNRSLKKVNPIGTPQAERQRGQLVLVIDDNVDATTLVSILLKLKGFQVITRNTGLEGIKAAEELQPAVILCDIGMPDMNGYETAKMIRQQPWGKYVPLVALTGYGQEEDKVYTKEAGFDGHLVKPVSSQDLITLLDNLLSKNG